MSVALAPVEIHVACRVCGQSERYTGDQRDVEVAGELWFTAHHAPVLLAVTFTDGAGSMWERRVL